MSKLVASHSSPTLLQAFTIMIRTAAAFTLGLLFLWVLSVLDDDLSLSERLRGSSAGVRAFLAVNLL